MTGCRDAGHSSEMDFVASLKGRNHDCRGPLLSLTLPHQHVTGIGDSLAGRDDKLWSSIDTTSGDAVTFTLCAAHWLDLSYLTGVSGTLNCRRDWFLIASELLHQILNGAGWDPKEMSNLLAWRRGQLT